MKKLLVTALLLIGLSTFAQRLARNQRKENFEQMTPQQKIELQIKKLSLELGQLNASQQKEMGKIITEMDAKREAFKTAFLAKKEAGTKLSSDERFAMQSKFLDEQIAAKERVKKILDADQFKKWEEMQEKRREINRKHQRGEKHRGSDEK